MQNIIDRLNETIKISNESKELFFDFTSNLHCYTTWSMEVQRQKPIFEINSKLVKCSKYDISTWVINGDLITFELLKIHYSSKKPFDIIGLYFLHDKQFYHITNVEKRICQFGCPVLSVTFDYFNKEQFDIASSSKSRFSLTPDDFSKLSIKPTETKTYDFWIPKEGHRLNVLSLITLFNENEMKSIRTRTEKKFPHHRVN